MVQMGSNSPVAHGSMRVESRVNRKLRNKATGSLLDWK